MSLLTIPLELRERIYAHLAEGVYAVLFVRGPGSESKKAKRQLPHYWRFRFENEDEEEIKMTLLKVCHQTRSDFIPCLATTCQVKLRSECRQANSSDFAISRIPPGYATRVRELSRTANETNLKDAVAFLPAVRKCHVKDDVWVTQIAALPNQPWNLDDFGRDLMQMEVKQYLAGNMKDQRCDPALLSGREPPLLVYESNYASFSAAFMDPYPALQDHYVRGKALERISGRDRAFAYET